MEIWNIKSFILYWSSDRCGISHAGFHGRYLIKIFVPAAVFIGALESVPAGAFIGGLESVAAEIYIGGSQYASDRLHIDGLSFILATKYINTQTECICECFKVHGHHGMELPIKTDS